MNCLILTVLITRINLVSHMIHLVKINKLP